MARTLEEIRSEILLRLRTKDAPNVDWSIESFDDLAPSEWQNGNTVRPGAVQVYAAFWQMVQEGIIIPGHRKWGRFEQNNGAFNGFPYFSITDYGRQVLNNNLRNGTDPADAAEYLDKLKKRAPVANNTVLRYVGESVSTFNLQKYLASAVLLGVAAEELLEQMYKALGAHLGAGGAAYLQKLQSKRWASQRLEYARQRLQKHLSEFPTEFQGRVDQYLDMLAQIIKTSRDDVGHARPLRVDREIAAMNLVSFPVLADIINEVLAGLSKPCPNP